MDTEGSHVVPVRTYLAVFAGLLILTALTVAVSYVDLGPMGLLVALAIASGKALLVVLFFMHVLYSTRLTWIVILASIFFLMILIGITMSDYLTRSWLPYRAARYAAIGVRSIVPHTGQMERIRVE